MVNFKFYGVFLNHSLKEKRFLGTSLLVQWLRHHTPSAGGPGLCPSWGTKIPHAAQCSQKRKKEKEISCFRFLSSGMKNRIIYLLG